MKYINRYKKRMILLILLIGVVIFIISTYTYTYSESIKIFKEEYVISGDTLWSIAEHEAENNLYFKGEDIRNIISELKNINNIKSSYLKVGQKILIPEI